MHRYGYRHKQERERWKRAIQAGGVTCARCGQPIRPDMPWDLDHSDDGGGYLGASHRRCNRAVAGNGVANPARPRGPASAHGALPQPAFGRHWWGAADRRRGCPCLHCRAHFAGGGAEVFEPPHPAQETRHDDGP